MAFTVLFTLYSRGYFNKSRVLNVFKYTNHLDITLESENTHYKIYLIENQKTKYNILLRKSLTTKKSRSKIIIKLGSGLLNDI